MARAQFQPLIAFAYHPSRVYGSDTTLGGLRLLRRTHPRAGCVAFGPRSDSDALRTQADEAGQGAHVVGMGELGHHAALAVMAASDAFVRSTTVDGDAISVREALSLGVRCIASDAAARPPGAVLFRSGNPEELAHKLRESLARPGVVHKGPDVGARLLNLYRAEGGG
jgi:glycosyltransferase involved in cell wall biosynthesis